MSVIECELVVVDMSGIRTLETGVVCRDCGAVVLYDLRGLHVAWHESLSEQVQS